MELKRAETIPYQPIIHLYTKRGEGKSGVVLTYFFF